MKRLTARANLARARRHLRRGAGVLVACLATTTIAHCAAQVSGNPRAVSVDAQNSSLKVILAELGKKFNFQAESSANLDKQLTGTYQGSLESVVSRLLEGYNFIIRPNQAGLDVTVFGATSAPFTVVAGDGLAAAASTAGQAQNATTAPSSPGPAAPAESAAAASAAPARILSQGPPLSPRAGAPSANDLVPGPATGPMPKPTPSTEAPPMPMGPARPFPMVGGTGASTPAANAARKSSPH